MALRDLFAQQLRQTDPVLWIDAHVRVNELGQPFRLADHQRDILRLAFRFDAQGKLPYDTILYSTIKKSGKTTVNALICLWWTFTQQPPDEVLICSNDLEQAKGRVFETIRKILEYNQLDPGAKVGTEEIRLSNGTTISALSSDYSSAAGSNHGLTSWDELWGYTRESAQRMYEELCPVPTRKNSIRFITTYSGFEHESKLLWDLYLRAVGPDEHPQGQGHRLHPTLPLYANGRTFAYWSHQPRMPWQTEAYIEEQRQTMRLSQWLRMWRNQWASSESAFLSATQWDACVEPSLRPLSLSNARLFLGVDAATKRDCAAVVGVAWSGEALVLMCHQIWTPEPGAPLDLETTIEAFLLQLRTRAPLAQVYYDPYQMARSAKTLHDHGLPMVEYSQTTGNLTLMGTTLSELIHGKQLRLYSAPDLRAHALAAVALESARGWKLSKEKASKPVDGLIALAMACRAATEAGHVEAVSIPPDEMEQIWREADAERHREALQAPAVPEPDLDDETLERERPRFHADRPPRWGLSRPR